MNLGSIQADSFKRSTMDSIPYGIRIGAYTEGAASIVCFGYKCTTIYIKRGI